MSDPIIPDRRDRRRLRREHRANQLYQADFAGRHFNRTWARHLWFKLKRLARLP